MGGERESKEELAFDIGKYLGKKVQIGFLGGVEVVGVVRAYDPLFNVVLEKARVSKGPETGPGDASGSVLDMLEGSVMMCKGTSIASIDLLSEKA